MCLCLLRATVQVCLPLTSRRCCNTRSSGADSESNSERVGFNQKCGDQDHVISDLSLASAILSSFIHPAGNRYDLNTCVSNSVVCISPPSAPDHITNLMNTEYGATMLHSDGRSRHSPCC